MRSRKTVGGSMHLSACVASVAAMLGVLASACGGVYYAAAINGASSRVAEAREVGAEQLAPYEYHYAREHLRQAEVEAAKAAYSDAAAFAETAEEYAQKAIEKARAEKSRAAGRP
jgi:hypothetical protein